LDSSAQAFLLLRTDASVVLVWGGSDCRMALLPGAIVIVPTVDMRLRSTTSLHMMVRAFEERFHNSADRARPKYYHHISLR
jgi:hypothetical protein